MQFITDGCQQPNLLGTTFNRNGRAFRAVSHKRERLGDRGMHFVPCRTNESGWATARCVRTLSQMIVAGMQAGMQAGGWAPGGSAGGRAAQAALSMRRGRDSVP